MRHETKKRIRRFMLMVGMTFVLVGGATAFFVLYQHASSPYNAERPPIPLSETTEESSGVDQKLAQARAVLEEARTLRMNADSFAAQLAMAEQFAQEGKSDEAEQILAELLIELGSAIQGEQEKPKIAITFDSGAGAKWAPDFIATLRSARMKLTLFSTGKWAEIYPQYFRDILMIDERTRNELGNHSYDHPHFVSDRLSDEAIQEQITRTEKIFESYGFAAKPLFRYPYGQRSRHTDEIIQSLGYTAVGWTYDSLGWKGELDFQGIADRVVRLARPNAIVVMHVGSYQDVFALPLIIERLKSTYRFVFVSEVL